MDYCCDVWYLEISPYMKVLYEQSYLGFIIFGGIIKFEVDIYL